ncbi:uncharacterized protein FPOAC1_013524 [Fusarium poae]|uniref:uncharacterized protein n=1 Tax=Fusarium poae TaxID=36050 RepID=UPI001D05A2D2|nr:uncharacterized protein FPOAC1_013524 [Fusarium poae]KAG8664744.1 hypothetical protein FPOAC1_013524 [Fusarium poae]
MLPSLPPSAFSFLRPPRNLASQFELTTQVSIARPPYSCRSSASSVEEQTICFGRVLVPEGLKGPLSPYWACRLCDAKGQPEFFAAAATSSAADHLRKPQTDRPAILVRPTDQSCRSDWVV